MGKTLGILAALLLSVAFPPHAAAARTWVSRDGKYTVEADLVDVEDGQAVLRRGDGSVLRVPLAKLSLGDVKYVQEAMAAANPAAAAPAPSTPASPATAQPQAAAPAASSGPPVAQFGKGGWQGAADPPSTGFGFSPDHKLEMRIPGYSAGRDLLFPSAPSSFVTLPDQEQKNQLLWDLRRGEMAGRIPRRGGYSQKIALSPDGAHFAMHINDSQAGDLIEIYAFDSGTLVHRMPLGKYPVVQFLDFAGPDRLVSGDSSSKAFLVWDIRSGQQVGRIGAEPSHTAGYMAISPGGSFLALLNDREDCVQIYDTRSGQLAGTLPLAAPDQYGHFRAESLIFSPDGQELAGWFDGSMEKMLACWDMATGKGVVELRFPGDVIRDMGQSRPGRVLEWLADRSGWLLEGIAIVDRKAGRVVWSDPEARSFHQKGPRRIVDAERMLEVVQTGNMVFTLRLEPIPRHDTAAVEAIASQGGEAADVGLPPLTLPDRSAMQTPPAAANGWAYQPDAAALPSEVAARNRFPLDAPWFRIDALRFARADVARVVLGTRFDPKPKGWPDSEQSLAHTFDIYDLKTAKKAFRFVLPFPTEMLDFSPDGKLGLFRRPGTEDRLDIWDLTDSRHVVAMRPYHDQEQSDARKVVWAAFVDATHLLTLSKGSELVCWELPACRAVYCLPLEGQGEGALSANRRVLVGVREGQTHLFDTRTGQSLGTLEPVRAADCQTLRKAQFRHDGRRLAAQFWHKEQCDVAIWDLTGGKFLARVELPRHALEQTWCGDDHLLVEPVPAEQLQPGTVIPCPLVDMARGMVTWNYRLEEGHHLWETPDGRHWFTATPEGMQQSELVAQKLPDPDTDQAIARTELPRPVLERGVRVAVDVVVENTPESSDPRWRDLASLDDSLTEHFTKLLQAQGIQVAADASTRLLVKVDEKNLERGAVLQRGLVGPGQVVILSKPMVYPRIAVLDDRQRPIWTAAEAVTDVDPTVVKPAEMDVTTLLRLERWVKAIRWLRTVTIPVPLLPPEAQIGLGESLLTPAGVRVLRTPPPKSAGTAAAHGVPARCVDFPPTSS